MANRKSTDPLTLQELVVWSVFVLAIIAGLFPGFFLRGDMLSATDLLYDQPPWIEYRSSTHTQAVNTLMYDSLMAFRPDFLAVQRCYSEGQWPLWNPLELGGVPLMANCQSTVFLPTRLSLLFLDVDAAMSLFILVKLWVCGMAAYVAARLFGLSRWPARFFSITWGFSCLCLVWAYWPIASVASWTPVVLAGAELLAQGRLKRGFFASLLGGTMLMFAGNPEIAFAFNLYITLYFLIRVLYEWRMGRAPWKPMGLFAASWIMIIGIYAVQMLPFLEYVANCHPMGEREIPLTPGALTTFWAPRFWGTFAEGTFWDKARYNSNLTIMQYVGAAVWFGAALACARAKDKRWRWRAQAMTLACVSALGILIAMNAPFVGSVNALPGFRLLRMLYHEFFALLALPMIASLGLDKWFAARRRPLETLWILLVVIPAALIIGAVYSQNKTLFRMHSLLGYLHVEMATAGAVFAVVALVLLASCFVRWRPAVFWAVLIVIAFADQVWPIRGLNPVLSRDGMIPDAALIRHLQDKPQPTRVDVFGAAIIRGTVGNFGIEEWDGYDGLFPERPVRFRQEFGTRIWDEVFKACAVEYYLNDPRFEELLPIGKLVEDGALRLDATVDQIEVYRNAAALPRARLVGKVTAVDSVEAVFARMLESDFRVAGEVVTEAPPEGPLPDSEDLDLGSARIIRYTPNAVAVESDAHQPCALVLADNYFPGWHAYVDGEPLEVFPAYYTFRGVLVPAGRHLVEFRYEPLSLRIGFFISVISLLTGAGLAVGTLACRKHA